MSLLPSPGSGRVCIPPYTCKRIGLVLAWVGISIMFHQSIPFKSMSRSQHVSGHLGLEGQSHSLYSAPVAVYWLFTHTAHTIFETSVVRWLFQLKFCGCAYGILELYACQLIFFFSFFSSLPPPSFSLISLFSILLLSLHAVAPGDG